MSTIFPQDLKKRLSNGENLVLLDVREKEELAGELGSLPGIIHIPLGELPSRLTELEQQKDKTLVAICKLGGRAGKAAQFLEQSGFKNVLVLDRGMTGWKESGLCIN